MEFKLGTVSFETGEDYRPRMLVITAPEKAKPKAGQMVMKQEQTLSRNVTLASEEVGDGVTAEAYAEAQLAAMKHGLQNFALVKRGTVSVGGVECPLFEIQSAGPEGRLLQAMTAYVVKNKVAYTLSASQMAGIPYQDTRKEYLEIFASLRVG